MVDDNFVNADGEHFLEDVIDVTAPPGIIVRDDADDCKGISSLELLLEEMQEYAFRLLPG